MGSFLQNGIYHTILKWYSESIDEPYFFYYALICYGGAFSPGFRIRAPVLKHADQLIWEK